MPKYKLEIPVNPITKSDGGLVVCNWSGGASSAVACFIAFEHFGSRCLFIHMQTNIEHPDTYRFLFDFERRLGVQVEQLQSEKFHEPEDVWQRYGKFSYAGGAACSSYLKRDTANKRLKGIDVWSQVFGFDASSKEKLRATNMTMNYPEKNPSYPLIQNDLDKQGVFKALSHIGITPPKVYQDFKNNNCLGTDDGEKGGCIQGGIGYWKRIQVIFPKKFNYMADLEHAFTDRAGEPRTVLTHTVGKVKQPLFLKPHPSYPEIADISSKKGRYEVETFECHGFCSTEEPKEQGE
jgi:hypothetical protein